MQADSAQRSEELPARGQPVPQSNMAELPPEMHGPTGSAVMPPLGNPTTNLQLLQACAS